MSHYLQHVPGRLRVKTAVLKNDAAKASRAHGLLGQVPGIDAVEVNAVTGSILVRYDEEVVTSAQILGLLVADGFINLLPDTRPKKKPALFEACVREQAIRNLGDALPKFVADLVIDKVVQRAATALVSAVI